MGFFDGFGAAIVGGGLDFAGSLFGASSSKKAAKRAAQLQIEIMKNRHQWEVQDLMAAGLNPVLSAGGSPPVGHVTPAAVPDFGRIGSSAVSAYNQARLAKKEIELADEQKELLREQQFQAATQSELNQSLRNKAEQEAAAAAAAANSAHLAYIRDKSIQDAIYNNPKLAGFMPFFDKFGTSAFELINSLTKFGFLFKNLGFGSSVKGARKK